MTKTISVILILGSSLMLQACTSAPLKDERCEASSPVYAENQSGRYCAAHVHFENFRI